MLQINVEFTLHDSKKTSCKALHNIITTAFKLILFSLKSLLTLDHILFSLI